MSRFAFLVLVFVPYVMGHGYLAIPPARNSMWREGFSTPKNYNDMGLNCGGYSNQWDKHDGECGLCGDPVQNLMPRDHEAGGMNAPYNRPISRCYNTRDNVMDITVRITAYHKGYFEFRLCVNNDMTSDDEDCAEEGMLLTIAGTYGATRYDINNVEQEFYTFQLDMPQGIVCTQCILQWKYNAGNNWGCDDDDCGMGFGKQENFINCADIAIIPDCNNVPATTDSVTVTTSKGTTNAPVKTDGPTAQPNWGCQALGVFAGLAYMDGWCTFNCLHPAIKICPLTYCSCGGDQGPRTW
ncbi:uncharacterized protein LOC132730123 [Ruditapes philippinarum]|uniref:uncharacterized protein LOC132730123 n=1 Tax=Ruditapes philippinarum TaxID=129788 RepID=UPI00295ACB9E|nr:uncharacterized protein LOC132730123 [Ruditapes philippinarum]